MKKYLRLLIFFILLYCINLTVFGQNIKILYYGEPSYFNRIDRVYIETSEKPLIGMIVMKTDENGDTKLVPIPCEGYKFTGWYKKGDYYIINNNTISKNIKNVVIYPRFEKRNKQIILFFSVLIFLAAFYFFIKNMYENVLKENDNGKTINAVKFVKLVITALISMGMLTVFFYLVYWYGPMIKDDVMIMFMLTSLLAIYYRKRDNANAVELVAISGVCTFGVWLVSTDVRYAEYYKNLTLSAKENIGYILKYIITFSIAAGYFILKSFIVGKDAKKYKIGNMAIMGFAALVIVWIFGDFDKTHSDNAVDFYTFWDFMMILFLVSGTEFLVFVLSGLLKNNNVGNIPILLTVTFLILMVFGENIESMDKGNLAPIKINGYAGYKNSSGKIVIEPAFSYVEEFQGGLAKVMVNGKYGIINKNGRFIVLPK